MGERHEKSQAVNWEKGRQASGKIQLIRTILYPIEHILIPFKCNFLYAYPFRLFFSAKVFVVCFAYLLSPALMQTPPPPSRKKARERYGRTDRGALTTDLRLNCECGVCPP